MAFRAAIYKCTDISQTEALEKIIYGLKAETSSYIRERNPKTLDEAMHLAKAFDVTRYGQ